MKFQSTRCRVLIASLNNNFEKVFFLENDIRFSNCFPFPISASYSKSGVCRGFRVFAEASLNLQPITIENIFLPIIITRLIVIVSAVEVREVEIETFPSVSWLISSIVRVSSVGNACFDNECENQLDIDNFGGIGLICERRNGFRLKLVRGTVKHFRDTIIGFSEAQDTGFID